MAAARVVSAQLPHLHKYTQKYSELYPDATQVLVRCEVSYFFMTPGQKASPWEMPMRAR